MIAHPERLRLGGERREITILFSDLAGFTSIAERLAPEQVSAVLNRHLSEITEAILEHSGTVDKFLGDGVMAFWGAPLADAGQTEHAVRAAIEMQRRMHELAAELAAQAGGAAFGMRIGLHRGECIVGNMGGDNRFEYTAVGDAVNLASRLEGANKVYGTRILASEAVAEACKAAIPFREVDTIRVKGKAIGIRVFTPCEDGQLVALSAEALAAYRAGRFADAARTWRALREAYPEDPVAALFLERLETLGTRPAPAGWDGTATLLEK
jgi:adenylate cyclase